MLTQSELASMRDTINGSLPGTAVLSTSQWVSDGGGGGTTSWVPSGTVSCRVTPASSTEAVAGDRLQPETEVIFTIPQGTSISTDSRIQYENRVFSVTSLLAPRTWEVSRRVEAKEIE